MNLYIFKNSKFYSYLFDLKSKEEIKQYLADLKLMHKKATHFCYAYLIKNQATESAGFSEDKEPSGVFNKNIFLLMQKNQVYNKILFVVRYFGKTKLGYANLQKSYTAAAKLVILTI